MSSIPEETLVELREKHGDTLTVLEKDGETIACKRPSRAEYKRFRSALFDERRRPEAIEQLVTVSVVWPDRQAFDALLERKPALAESFGDALLEVLGSGKAEVVARPKSAF